MTDFSKPAPPFICRHHLSDGNSLGPLPKAATARVAEMMQAEWGEKLITGWNACDWMAQPSHLGDRIATLIELSSGTVMIGDTLSIKVYQAVAAALQLRPGRKVILSDNGNFPTDLYMHAGCWTRSIRAMTCVWSPLKKSQTI